MLSSQYIFNHGMSTLTWLLKNQVKSRIFKPCCPIRSALASDGILRNNLSINQLHKYDDSQNDVLRLKRSNLAGLFYNQM